jgi:hypothetical protein
VRIYWWPNGALLLEPETAGESDALLVLSENMKVPGAVPTESNAARTADERGDGARLVAPLNEIRPD